MVQNLPVGAGQEVMGRGTVNPAKLFRTGDIFGQKGEWQRPLT